MSTIKFEKYVAPCVRQLCSKVSENSLIEYVNYLSSSRNPEYKDLATYVVYYVCRSCFKPFKEFSEEDYNDMNDNTLRSLYFKAFQTAFPSVWRTIKPRQ